MYFLLLIYIVNYVYNLTVANNRKMAPLTADVIVSFWQNSLLFFYLVLCHIDCNHFPNLCAIIMGGWCRNSHTLLKNGVLILEASYIASRIKSCCSDIAIFTFSHWQAISFVVCRSGWSWSFFWQLPVFQSHFPSLTRWTFLYLESLRIWSGHTVHECTFFPIFFVLVVDYIGETLCSFVSYGYFKSKISTKYDAIEYDFCWSKSLTYFESAIYLLGFSTHRINKNSNLNLKAFIIWFCDNLILKKTLSPWRP